MNRFAPLEEDSGACAQQKRRPPRKKPIAEENFTENKKRSVFEGASKWKFKIHESAIGLSTLFVVVAVNNVSEF